MEKNPQHFISILFLLMHHDERVKFTAGNGGKRRKKDKITEEKKI